MLRRLKSNNPILLVVNLLLIIGYRLIFFFTPSSNINPIHSEPLSDFLFGRLHCFFTPAFFVVAGGVMCFLQSLQVNALVNNHKATNKKNYLGGIIFIAVSSLFPEFLRFSPAQVALFFLLLLCEKIFRLTRPEKQLGAIFDLGFFTGLSMLFYFPSLLFLPFALLAIYTMRPFSLRELWIVLIGLGTVVYSVFIIYFWFDSLPLLLTQFANFSMSSFFDISVLSPVAIITLVWYAVLLLVGIVAVQPVLLTSSIQTRKYTSTLTFLVLFVLGGCALHFHFDGSHFVLLTPTLSFLLCLFCVETKIEIVAEVLLAVLVLSVPILQILPFFIS